VKESDYFEVPGVDRKIILKRTLNFESLSVSLRTARFDIKKFYMVLALR
jgi:hypothetical protein